MTYIYHLRKNCDNPGFEKSSLSLILYSIMFINISNYMTDIYSGTRPFYVTTGISWDTWLEIIPFTPAFMRNPALEKLASHVNIFFFSILHGCIYHDYTAQAHWYIHTHIHIYRERGRINHKSFHCHIQQTVETAWTRVATSMFPSAVNRFIQRWRT